MSGMGGTSPKTTAQKVFSRAAFSICAVFFLYVLAKSFLF